MGDDLFERARGKTDALPRKDWREGYAEQKKRWKMRRARGDFNQRPEDMTHLRGLLKTLPEELQLDAAKARRKREAKQKRESTPEGGREEE